MRVENEYWLMLLEQAWNWARVEDSSVLLNSHKRSQWYEQYSYQGYAFCSSSTQIPGIPYNAQPGSAEEAACSLVHPLEKGNCIVPNTPARGCGTPTVRHQGGIEIGTSS